MKPVWAPMVFVGMVTTLVACSNTVNQTPSASLVPASGMTALSAVSGVSSKNTGLEQPRDVLATSAYNNPVLLDPAGSTIISDQTKFSYATFGVKGSPRVEEGLNVRKGGGRYHVGKPYTIRGVRYVPKEDPDYRATGYASWYGPNFHGRLTANGEVYDQFALSGAHPTLPLPSYARVTNVENGASVIVRINDRGPFTKGRIIDLSSQAAHMLGYAKKGVAKVKVEYVGKARLDGLDDETLMASYDPGSLSMPSGEEILAANKAADNRQKLALAKPQKRAGKPLSSFSFDRFGDKQKPSSDSVLPPPQPLALISGYQSFSPPVSASLAIEDWLRPGRVVAKNGADSLARFAISDIRSKAELEFLTNRLSGYGPVTLLSDRAPYTLLAIIPKEDISAIQRIVTPRN